LLGTDDAGEALSPPWLNAPMLLLWLLLTSFSAAELGQAAGTGGRSFSKPSNASSSSSSQLAWAPVEIWGSDGTATTASLGAAAAADSASDKGFLAAAAVLLPVGAVPAGDSAALPAAVPSVAPAVPRFESSGCGTSRQAGRARGAVRRRMSSCSCPPPLPPPGAPDPAAAAAAAAGPTATGAARRLLKSCTCKRCAARFMCLDRGRGSSATSSRCPALPCLVLPTSLLMTPPTPCENAEQLKHFHSCTGYAPASEIH
jgi:hypothetical protein